MSVNESVGDWVPDACSLPTAEQPLRVAEFDLLFATSLRGLKRPAADRLLLILDSEAEVAARDLAARETSCCSFFMFSLDDYGPGLTALAVSVPSSYAGVLDALANRAEAARSRPGGGR